MISEGLMILVEGIELAGSLVAGAAAFLGAIAYFTSEPASEQEGQAFRAAVIFFLFAIYLKI